ncbi:lantibiotic dehydratase [Saccharopolyspora hattusasensis]|uniref:lantibiotic dehydratase n=1 Tax=Saccharopolyspora hattusasensis TaxID=1128679 RepID=UPI003D95A210
MPAREDYQHHGTGLLRAAAGIAEPHWWPNPADEQECREWLRQTWTLPGLAPAIRHASPVLAAQTESILAEESVSARNVQRAALAVVRYALRFTGRSTPFGMFAGVSTASVGATTKAQWGASHRPVAHADNRWLHQVIERLEGCVELLGRLDVIFNSSTELRGARLELPGQDKISVRKSGAVLKVRDAATSPIRFDVLADRLVRSFPGAGDPRGMLISLVRNGFLLTALRAPSTITDPFGYILGKLRSRHVHTLRHPRLPIVEWDTCGAAGSASTGPSLGCSSTSSISRTRPRKPQVTRQIHPVQL